MVRSRAQESASAPRRLTRDEPASDAKNRNEGENTVEVDQRYRRRTGWPPNISHARSMALSTISSGVAMMTRGTVGGEEPEKAKRRIVVLARLAVKATGTGADAGSCYRFC